MTISRRTFVQLLSSPALLWSPEVSAAFRHSTPVLQAPTLDLVAASDTGASSTDNITNNNIPNIDIILGALPFENDVVNIYDNGVLVASHTITAVEVANSAFNLGLSALSDGTHILTASYSSGGHASLIGPGLTIVVDTVAPSLSSATGAQNGSNETEVDLSISSDTGVGTLYWIVTPNGTAPSAAQIIAGEDQSGSAATTSGSVSVSATGTKSITAVGVSASNTYFAHFLHTDIAGNNSSVATSPSWVQTVGSWTPASLTGLLAWYKGDVGVTTTGAPNYYVRTWADQSGNGYNLTSTGEASSNPSIDTLNSLAVVKSGGVSDAQGLINSYFALGGTTLSVFAVMRQTSATPTTSRGVIFLGSGHASETDNAASLIALYFPTSTQLKAFHNSSNAVNNGISQNTWAQMGSIFDGTNLTVYVANVAGTPVAQGGGSFGATGALELFQNANGGNPLSGSIAELVITNTALGATDRATLATYFTNRWGV
jgi:hypothetical protein